MFNVNIKLNHNLELFNLNFCFNYYNLFIFEAACLFILYVILTLPLRVKTSKEVLLDVFFPRERRDSLSKHFFLTFCKKKKIKNKPIISIVTLIFCILPSAFLYQEANSITNIVTTMLNPIVITLFLLYDNC